MSVKVYFIFYEDEGRESFKKEIMFLIRILNLMLF